MKKLATVLMLGSAVLSGCATTGYTPEQLAETQDVRFTSEPTGATITVSGKTCTAPCTLNLGVMKLHTVRATLDGHFPEKQGLVAQSVFSGAPVPTTMVTRSPDGGIRVDAISSSGVDNAFNAVSAAWMVAELVHTANGGKKTLPEHVKVTLRPEKVAVFGE